MMQIIKELVEEIKEELEGAGEYAEKAVHYKGVDDPMAAMYYEMAGQEMGHVDRLHARVQEVIKKYRSDHGEPPKAMQAIWDWHHKEMIERAGEIRGMLEMIKK